MSDPGHDGAVPRSPLPSLPDAHGEAALLLVESLIHGLVARSGLTRMEAVEIVETAVDTQVEISDDRGEDPSVTPSVRMLTAIAVSLGIDQSEDHGNLDPDESNVTRIT